jgi:Fe-S cluster assembly iron-binding protein IscA
MVTLSDKAASEIKNIMQQNGGAFEGIRVCRRRRLLGPPWNADSR